MSKLLLALGWVLLVVGLFIMAMPFVSTSRFASESLEALPQVNDVATVDDNRGVLALFDRDDFTLSTRTYRNTEIAAVEAALSANGFETYFGRTPSQNGMVLPVENEWDGLLVYLQADGTDTIVRTTAIDTDIVAFWPLMVFAGATFVFAGAAMLLARRATASSPKSEELELVSSL